MVPAIGYGAIGSNHAERFFPNLNGLGPVAWSDSCPPGIQTVWQNILFRGDLFLLPSTDSSRAAVGYWRKRCALSTG